MSKYFEFNNPDHTHYFIFTDGRYHGINNLLKQITLEYLSWTEVVDTNNLSMPLDELLYIIDDCLVYHIEFKVENHKLYIRNY